MTFHLLFFQFPEFIASFFSGLSWPFRGSTSPTAAARNILGSSPFQASQAVEASIKFDFQHRHMHSYFSLEKFQLLVYMIEVRKITVKSWKTYSSDIFMALNAKLHNSFPFNLLPHLPLLKQNQSSHSPRRFIFMNLNFFSICATA